MPSKPVGSYHALVLAACGCLLAAQAMGTTLGRARAAVLIGRPLDVQVATTLDAADGSAPCADAEVFHGDRRIERPPVVRWEPGAPGQGNLRITTTVAVDEPMVTVYLRVGCGQSVTRKYVLLAEPLQEVETMPTPPPAVRVAPMRNQPVRAPAAPGLAAGTGQGASLGEAAEAAGSVPVPRAAPRLTPAPAIGAAPPRTAPAVSPGPTPAETRPAPATERRSRARLKLDPIDLTQDRDPTLRPSAELKASPTDDTQARQTAAALWDVLRKPPEDALRDAQRLQALERDLDSLRQQTQQNANALVVMREQVEKARSERNMLALVGAGLLVLLLVAGAWLVTRLLKDRQARRARWFDSQPSDLASVEARPAPPVQDDEPASEADELAPSATPRRPKSVAVPVPMPPVRGPLYTPAPPAPRNTFWNSGEDFQPSQGGSIRMVGVEELIDIQDKANFFVSLGQVDQAVAILEAHVHDQVETSPLAWLDLLELYHTHGRRDDFARLRGEFRARFAADVPEFDDFDKPTGGLEHYERALSRIVALWPSRKVLEVIEESIFRKPGLPGSDAFSLEAYRELLLLYHVAAEVAPDEDMDEEPDARRPAAFKAAPSGFANTNLEPLSAEDEQELMKLSPELLLVPPSSSRLGLDIDLGDLPDAAAAKPMPSALVGLELMTTDTPRAPAASRPATAPRASRSAAMDEDTIHFSPHAESGEMLEVDFDTGFFDDLTDKDTSDGSPKKAG